MSAPRHVVSVQSNHGGNDLDGVPVEDWREERKVFARIIPLVGREYIASRQANLETTHKIETEFFSGASAVQRLICGERVFHVESVINSMERNRRLIWMTRETL